MRTDQPHVNASSTAAKAVAKVRAEYQRARRRFLARPAALRWSIGLAALASFAGLIYGASTALPSSTTTYVALRGGMKFSTDDRNAIAKALDAKHLEYRVDDRNRVEVPVDHASEANDAIAKLGVGPKRFDDIRKDALSSNPFDSISVSEQRRIQANNEFLETTLEHLPGIVDATVRVNRPAPRGGRATAGATAFVMIETENDRELSSTIVERIQSLIAGAEPDIKHDSVTVFDTSGRNYLDARNPSRGEETHIRAREESLKEEILEKLDRIKGVEVSVKLVPGPVIPPPTPLPPLPAAKPAEPVVEPIEIPLPSLSMGVNQPIELEEEAKPAPTPAEKVAPVVVAPPPAPVPVMAPVSHKVKVLVNVPRSYFLRAVRDKAPSLEDYQPLVERTEKLIITAVHHVVPPGQLEEPVAVSIIPEDVSEPKLASTTPDTRRTFSWWVPAGIGAVLSATFTFLLFRAFAGRRPLSRALAEELGRGRVYKIDEPSNDGGPGPSERVRELIRLNPQAAASVLHRWTGHGQGEPIA